MDLYSLRFFLLLLNHFSIPKNIPDDHIQMPSTASSSGRKNESTQKLFVKPVETVLAPKTAALVTTTEALAAGVYPEFELDVVTFVFNVVVP